ncbi:MAG: copper transporter [Nocardioidaceae bacterium]
MISFRYHVTTLVAVLLALAAGVALGGGPLSEVGRPDPTPAAATDSATDDRGSDFADALAGQGAARMYGNRLEDVAVSIVSFPGASDATRSALTEQVQAAGGRVAATYAVQPGLVDTGEKTLVDTLGSQLMTQLPDGTVSADASTYQRIGELIGIATASTEPTGSKSLGDQSGTILSSLAGADLLSSTGKASGRASYVVLLLGEETDAEADPVYTGLVSGLAAHVAGIVVAGDDADGRLGRLRADPVAAEVATVDGVSRPAGEVTTVLAITEWPSTRGGSFGESGPDGAVGLR